MADDEVGMRLLPPLCRCRERRKLRGMDSRQRADTGTEAESAASRASGCTGQRRLLSTADDRCTIKMQLLSANQKSTTEELQSTPAPSRAQRADLPWQLASRSEFMLDL